MSYYRTLLNYSASALKNALLAVYKFENNGDDSLGNYNATSIGSAVTFSSTNAVNGLAMQTANSVNSRISLPVTGNPFSFTTGTVDKPFSIKANIYLRGLGTQQSIFTKYNGSNNSTSEFIFYVRTTNQLAILLFNKTGSVYIGAFYSVPFVINTPYNVVVTYNGSGVWTGIKMYVNGTSVTLSALNSGTGYTSMGITALVPTIGNNVVTSNPFIGMIDELYVFNGAISQTDVTTLQTQYYPNF